MATQSIKYENSTVATDAHGNILIDDKGNAIIPITPPVVFFNAGLINALDRYAPVVTGKVSHSGSESGFSFYLPEENDKIYQYAPFDIKLVKHRWRNCVGVGVVLNLRAIEEQYNGVFEFSITTDGYYRNAPDAEIEQVTIDGKTWYYTKEEYSRYLSAVRWGDVETELPPIHRCSGGVNHGKFTVTCSDYSFEINTDGATISGGGRGESDFGYFFAGPCGGIWQEEPEPEPTEYEWRADKVWCDGKNGIIYYTGDLLVYPENAYIDDIYLYIFNRTQADFVVEGGESIDSVLERESTDKWVDGESREYIVITNSVGTEYVYWRDTAKDSASAYTIVELNKVVNNNGDYFYTDAINASSGDNNTILGSNVRYGWHKDNVSTSPTANPADYPYGEPKGVYCNNEQIGVRLCKDADGNYLAEDYWMDGICGGVSPCAPYASPGVTSITCEDNAGSYFYIGVDDICHNAIYGEWTTVYSVGDFDYSQHCYPVIGAAGYFLDRSRWGVHALGNNTYESLGVSNIRNHGDVCPYIFYCKEWEGFFYYIDAETGEPYGKGYVWKAEGQTTKAWTLSPCHAYDVLAPAQTIYTAGESLTTYTTEEGASGSIIRNGMDMYQLIGASGATYYRADVPPTEAETTDEEFE